MITDYFAQYAPEGLVTQSVMVQMASDFQAAIKKGLAGKSGSLKMLPAFLATPTGQETGRFLAVDFGGTNLRVLDIELLGQGHYTIHAQRKVSLAQNGEIDYTAALCQSDTLFDFIARQIALTAEPNRPYSLGHTFSFPSHQTNSNQATLFHWTKELHTCGVEGTDINQALHEALLRQGLSRIRPVAILNDTVGTLLAAAYTRPTTDIGSICGTGHNTAYFEPSPPNTSSPMIINLESGNFNQLPFTHLDRQLDAHSDKPGEQLLEKMVSGRYLGELLRLAAIDLCRVTLPADHFCACSFDPPWSFSGDQVSAWIQDRASVATWLSKRTGLASPEYLDALQTIAASLCARSARLAAATYIGILQHLDPDLETSHHIAVDGSLFEKMPGYREEIQRVLADTYGAKADLIGLSFCKDGSGVGAAIAAALAAKG